MNYLDLAIVALATGAALAGYRLGFVARVLSWVGLGSGLYVAARLLPSLLPDLGLSSAGERLAAAAAILVGAGLVGQAVGLLFGARLHAVLPLGPLRSLDRVVGALVGALGVLIALWLLLPAISSVQGIPARAVRSSAIARFVSTLRGPPNTLEALRRLVGSETFPEVFAALGSERSAGTAPTVTPLSQALVPVVTASTVKVEGLACNRVQDGSGFTVGPDMVITNAHVVAGEAPGATQVIEPTGSRLSATVVSFDPDRDLALLVVNGLAERPLTIAAARVGDSGAVFGHPGGQAETAVVPARISSEVSAVGRDLYDSQTTQRDVLVLASNLAPGDSGGALVTRTGQVAGVAFAIDPGQPGTSYALSSSVLRSFLASSPTAGGVSTRSCLDG